MLITLTRIRQNDLFTLGVLTSEIFRPLYTLEPPWKDNAPNASCIPVGVYRCDPFPSPKFGLTWKLRGVPDRSDIVLHWGSYVHDTRGCPLLGCRFYEIEDFLVMLSSSKVGFLEFRQALQGNQIDSFDLEIK